MKFIIFIRGAWVNNNKACHYVWPHFKETKYETENVKI